MNAFRLVNVLANHDCHPYSFEHASLTVRGSRRRALNYEAGAEPHFDAQGRRESKG
jgi:hypothetical protein